MHKFNQLLLVLFIFIMFESALNVAAQGNEIAGTWQSIGYGIWFDITEEDVNVYQVSEASCVEMLNVGEMEYDPQAITLRDVTISGLGQYMGSFEYDIYLENNLLNFEIGKVNPIQAQRVDALPSICDEMTGASPEESFDALWHVFNEHYAFFDVRGLDWNTAYETYRPLVTSTTTDEELFAIMQEMLSPFGDGHVSINTFYGSYYAITLPEWLGDVTEDEMEDKIADFAIRTANTYLMNEPQTTANGGIIYGKISDSVGYMSILTFDGSLNEGDSEHPLADSMAEVIENFAGLDAIIVDVRLNFGGEDTNGFFIAGQFTDETVQVAQKTVWYDDVFNPIADIYVEPTTDNPFMGDVYLLTSRTTISAAETFALAMRELPNVTLIGEPTNGMLSDAWFVILPNGWIATLSNEQYLTVEGVSFESLGVPPDVEIPMTNDLFVGDSNDSIMDTALDLAR